MGTRGSDSVHRSMIQWLGVVLLLSSQPGLGAEPSPEPTWLAGGWVDGDTDPQHMPLQWTDQPRPALDYRNRSFGRHLGWKRPVHSITILNDLPRGECRIDANHTELYYGDCNGRFLRYSGPMSFSRSESEGKVLIALGDLDLTTTIVKVRFAYPDDDYTAVSNSIGEALRIEPVDEEDRRQGLRVSTTLSGKNQFLRWRPTLGGWSARGNELVAIKTPQSEHLSGEGARAFLPYNVSGDFDFDCQFLLPDISSGAGGPVIYFRAQEDGSLYALRYVNYWGTAVLQKKPARGPWTEIGYATGQNLAVDEWHELHLTARGNKFSVVVDGRKLVEGRDGTYTEGVFGLGCQVRQVRFREIRVSGEAMKPVPEWAPTTEPKPYRVVCHDAGHGGYQAFPGLCRLKSGDLLAVFYAGWEHVSRPGERLPKGGAAALSRSTDDGKTWSPAQTVLDTPYDDRDPAVWQCDDGTLVVSTVSVDWPSYRPPYDDWCYAHIVRSTDDGQTWSQPEELRIGKERDYTVWTEPRRLNNGEWLWPLYHNRGPRLTTAFMRSTDGGLTWSDPQLIDKGSFSTDEPDICQFSDGTIFCAMRPVGEPHMWQSWSRDQGETWTKPEPLPFYGHCSNLLHTRNGVTLLAVRDPGMCVRYSFDQAKSWAGAAMIDACGGAYSQMVELADGRVLIVYYTEGRQSEIRAQFLRADSTGLRVVPP